MKDISEIIKALGGEKNITGVTNCMTRLRVVVKDESLTDEESLKKLDDVLGLVHDRNDHYEIVVGPGKCKRYADELHEMGIGLSDGHSMGDDRTPGKKKGRIKAFFKIVGDIFVPMIPGVMTAGLCAGFASLLTQVFPEYADNKVLFVIYNLLTLVSTSFMTYITAWAGYRAAERFGATPILGGMLGMITSLDGINRISQTIGLYDAESPLASVLCTGKGGVLAVIFGVFLLSAVEKKLHKKIPANVDIILTPLLTVLICVIPYIIIVMPLFGYVSEFIMKFISDLCLSENVYVRAVAGYISAALFLPLVAGGMHHGLVALYTVQLEEIGYITLYPALAMAGAGQVGAGLAIMRKAKKAGNTRLLKVSVNALPAGILGVGEPLIYGVTLPLGRPFIAAGLGAGFGGALVMIMQVASTTWGPSGVLGAFVMTAGPNGAIKNVFVYFAALLISYIGGYVLTALTTHEKDLISEKDAAGKATIPKMQEGSDNAKERIVKHGDIITFELKDGGFLHIVTDPYGIHARPAAELVKIAQNYDATITISANDRCASCKSLAELMNLGASKGTELIVNADGPDASKALPEIRKFLNEKL